MAGTVNLLSTFSAASGYVWNTTQGQDWWDEVVARGGGSGVDDALKALIDDGIAYLDGTGDLAELDRLWIWRGDSIAARTSIVNPTSTAPVEVNSPTFHATNGYTFDGASTYLNLKFNPYTDGVKFAGKDDALWGVSHHDATDEYGKFDFGNSTDTEAIFTAVETPGGVGWIFNSATYQTQPFYGDGNYFMKAGSGGTVNVLSNGNSSSTGHSTVAVPNLEIYSGCYNYKGTPINFKNVRQRFILFGSYNADLSNLDYALNTYFLA
jgi:hypothetical protein